MANPLIQYTVTAILTVIFSVSSQWKTVDAPGRANIRSLAIKDSILFASTFFGGIFRSTNNGASWNAFNSGLTNHSNSSVKIYDNKIFITTSTDILQSTDNGITWITVMSNISKTNSGSLAKSRRFGGPPDPDVIKSFALNDSNLFIGTYYGLFRSSHSGKTWVEIDSGIPDKDIEYVTAGDKSLFTVVDSCIYRSLNNGTTWDLVFTDRNIVVYGIHGFAINDASVYVGYSNCILHSVDDGATWSKIVLNQTENDVSAILTNRNTLMVGAGGTLFLSDDAGASWTEVNLGNSLSILCLAANGNDIFAGTYENGIYRSSDNGASWTEANSGLWAQCISAITTDGRTIVVGEYGISNVFISNDAGILWRKIAFGFEVEPTSCAIKNNTIFLGTGYGDTKLLRSTDNGSTWDDVKEGFPEEPEIPSIGSLAINGSSIFAYSGWPQLYRSTDNGTNWSVVTSYEQVYSLSLWPFITAINGTLFSQTGQSILRSVDNGDNWARIEPMPEFNTVSRFTGIGTTIYAENDAGDVFISSDNGITWTKTGNGQSLQGRTITSMTTYGNNLFAGTSNVIDKQSQERNWSLPGIFLSSDKGKSWTVVDSNLPNSDITALAVCGGNLFAGTYGNGVSYRPLSEMVGVDDRNRQEPKNRPIDFKIRAPQHSDVTIAFTLPHSDRVSATVYNLSGKSKSVLVNQYLGPGTYTYRWNTGNLAPGCYAIRMQAGTTTFVKSFPVIK